MLLIQVLTGILADAPDYGSLNPQENPIDAIMMLLITFIFIVRNLPDPALLGIYMVTVVARATMQLRLMYVWFRGTWLDKPKLYRRLSWYWLSWVIIELPCRMSGFDTYLIEMTANFDPQTVSYPVFDNFYPDLPLFLFTLVMYVISVNFFPLFSVLTMAAIGTTNIIGNFLIFLLVFGLFYNFVKAARNDWDDQLLMDAAWDFARLFVVAMVVHGWSIVLTGMDLLAPSMTG